MNDILAQLAMAQQHQQLVEIHHFINSDTYTVGLVIKFTKSICLVKSLDPDGKINGILLINVAEIYAVENDTDYLQAMKLKAQLAKKRGYYDILNVAAIIAKIEIKRNDFWLATLTDFANTKSIVTVGFTDDAQLDAMVTGMITQIDGQITTINYVDEYDLSSLWTLHFDNDAINYLRFNSFQTIEYEVLMQTLFKNEL